jgi:hypothetical protein
MVVCGDQKAWQPPTGYSHGWMKTGGELIYCSNDHNKIQTPRTKEGALAKEELSNQIASKVD